MDLKKAAFVFIYYFVHIKSFLKYFLILLLIIKTESFAYTIADLESQIKK